MRLNEITLILSWGILIVPILLILGLDIDIVINYTLIISGVLSLISIVLTIIGG